MNLLKKYGFSPKKNLLNSDTHSSVHFKYYRFEYLFNQEKLYNLITVQQSDTVLFF